MNSTKVNQLAAGIGRYLRMNRASVMREDRIHDAIAAALSDLGIEAEREYRLSANSRLDFWLLDLGIAVEVKRGAAGVQILHQIGKYFESAKVTGCILVAMRIHAKVPAEFAGKPIAQVPLWKYLL